MITDLTRFCQLTLRKSGELITIRDELEIAGLYLNPEKLCHNHKLNWRIDLEDGIRTDSGSFIQISGIYGDDTVIMKIEENGAGITEDELIRLSWRKTA